MGRYTIMGKTILAYDLKRYLRDNIMDIPDDAQVSIGPPSDALSIYRVKLRGQNLYVIEFNEDYKVTFDPTAPREAPHKEARKGNQR